MGTNIIFGIVIAIVVIAAILYAIGYFMRKKNQEKLDVLEKRKENLFDLPVIEEVDEVKKCIWWVKAKTHSENGTSNGQIFPPPHLRNWKAKSLKSKS